MASGQSDSVFSIFPNLQTTMSRLNGSIFVVNRRLFVNCHAYFQESEMFNLIHSYLIIRTMVQCCVHELKISVIGIMHILQVDILMNDPACAHWEFKGGDVISEINHIFIFSDD